MIEKKFIEEKKNEYEIKEFIKKELGKGKMSNIRIERTPIGERIMIYTSRPGLVIGRRGEIIQSLTTTLQKQFKLENPKIEIVEIAVPEFDAQTMADQLALTLERLGPNVFKTKAYATLERIKSAGALGCEIILSGKLPGEKARSWRFFFGYLKKTGETDIVNKGAAIAQTIPGIVGIKIIIVPKDAKIPDRIEIPEPVLQPVSQEIQKPLIEAGEERNIKEESGEKIQEEAKEKKKGQKTEKRGRKKKAEAEGEPKAETEKEKGKDEEGKKKDTEKKPKKKKTEKTKK